MVSLPGNGVRNMFLFSMDNRGAVRWHREAIGGNLVPTTPKDGYCIQKRERCMSHISLGVSATPSFTQHLEHSVLSKEVKQG